MKVEKEVGDRMLFSPRFYVLVTCSVVLLATMACSLGGAVPTEVTQPTVMVNPTVPAPEATQPTVMVNPTLSASTLTLTLPDGHAVVLPVAQCKGTSPGGYLELSAVNTEDTTDPDRIEVVMSGDQQGPGQYGGFYVLVRIGVGVAEELIFMGNTADAQVTIEANGAGRFADIAIANVANFSPTYEYGTEYLFSAQWVCAP